MKISLLFTFALLGAVSAQETCVEGKRVTISPGYTVEYKCNAYRTGTAHDNIPSADACAAKCRDASRSVCTYNSAQKKCVVGDENGREGTSPGAFYMSKVDEPEDPFADTDDPFAQTCDAQKTACLGRETALKAQLTQCQAALAAAQSSTPTPNPNERCKVPMWGQGWYNVRSNTKMDECKRICQAEARCLSYSNNDVGTPGSGPNNCYLYDKLTKDVPVGSYANWAQYDKTCA